MSSKFKSFPRLSKMLLLFRAQPEVVQRSQAEAEATPGEAAALPAFSYTQTVLYITTERQANDALRSIVSGKVGFDTEYTTRRPTPEEQFIIDAFPAGGAIRKHAVLGWQIVEMRTSAPFRVAWNNIGLRLVQIATDTEAFVLDMWKIRGEPPAPFPFELERILKSPDIAKVGVGATNEILVFWDDLRTEMKSIVDAGMMAKLLLAEQYPKLGYGPLSLKTSVADVLHMNVKKEQTESNWRADELTADQKEYAAIDAIASLALHDALEVELANKSANLAVDIPTAWYTFNTKCGEPIRVKPAMDGSDVPWKVGDCTWYSGGKFIGYP
ncbi:ribonuclease H-like domain-containing protein [Mycena polygramma]|nr:ribonuclease H-like domain-containing protein [Mycena polygramma]